MKTSLKLFALGMILMGFSVNANAQVVTATGNSTANAAVLQALTITPGTALNFGTFIPSTGGTVIIPPVGVRTFSGAVTTAAVGITPSAGVFAITGTSNALFSITLPDATTTLTGSVSGTMTILSADWTANLSETAASIGSNGTVELRVGATLQVGAAQAAGSYQGNYAVTVAYN